jgi:hypothetical protein
MTNDQVTNDPLLYSLLSDCTGFARAARNAYPATVINAMPTAIAPAKRNTPTPNSVR